MPRPADLTESEAGRWTVLALDCWSTAEPAARLLARSDFVEIYLAGEWLGDRLAARGLGRRRRHDLCFAAGQIYAAARIAGQADPWPSHAFVLDELGRGREVEPGPRLAASLMGALATVEGTGPNDDFEAWCRRILGT